ncbi:RNA polymerase sigma factor [Candidatus Contubernalis alkaliaceticus]|uniref:RNA polymerase sigma factor n=1 Tax=Candidatus Contubernalis alkaliaceticus TaxID=338645 RepID=UPI001F4BFF32|nr:RNA polymerase sigma factor [Candidatus Contubernalis alkalaceticus]UNC92282.1 RNA polymerase sigma factor [Candidatus Contubernalis alkalaceticus]
MDITELSDLVIVHGKYIYRFCYKLEKNGPDADDLYQETFLKAMELCHKIDNNSNPKGFLISIALGLWKNKCRKFAWRQRIAPTKELKENVSNHWIFMEESTPEEIVIYNEQWVMLQAAADTLTNKLKIPLYMYYVAEMSVNDIASVLKIPQGTVKSRLHKARKILKKILEVHEYENF